jgi:4-hydroxy-2-oxoglutarate aldolase
MTKVSPVRVIGLLGPVTTPFARSNGALDLEAFQRNVKAHVAAGLSGVVVAGSTGEAALLDREERRSLAEAARSAVGADKLVVVGAGAEATRSAVLLARDAAAAGADAVLVVAPHYYGSQMTVEALRAHYTRLADESPLPVLLYNIPRYMHFGLGAELVAELALHPNITGIKDSSGSQETLGGFLACKSDTFGVLTGSAKLWSWALDRGAVGGILAVGLFAPDLALQVMRIATGKAAADGGAAQARLDRLAGPIVGDMGVPGVKAALDAVGLEGGPLRMPLLPLEGAPLGEMNALLREAGLTA